MSTGTPGTFLPPVPVVLVSDPSIVGTGGVLKAICRDVPTTSGAFRTANPPYVMCHTIVTGTNQPIRQPCN